MPLPPSYPGALDALANPTGATYADDTGFFLDEVIARAQDILELLEAKLGTGSTVPARNKALVGNGANASVWDTIERKNRVINGDMRVSQRATLGTTDDSYTLDQWTMLLEAATAAVAAQEASDVPADGSKRGLRLTVGAAANNKFGAVNFIPFADCADLRGKQVSLQVKLKATAGITNVRMAVLEWTGTADTLTSDVVSVWGADGTNPTLVTSWAYLNTPVNLSPTTSWATYRIEGVSVGASANNLAVFIWCDDKTTTTTTDVLRITDVQLEEGAVCTDVERQPYVQSLVRCQHFYRELGVAVPGAFMAATTWGFGVVFDPPMRVGPSATLLVSTMSVVEITTAVRTGTSAALTGATSATDGYAGSVAGTGFAGTVGALAVSNLANWLALTSEL